MNNLLPIIFASSLLLSGCGGSGGSSESGNSSALNGTWESPCNDYFDGTSSKSEFTYTSGRVQALYFDYSDLSCISKSATETIIGNYVTGNSVTTSSGVVATEINLTAETVDGESVSRGAEYTIFYIDADRLYFGDNSDDSVDGSSSSKRPIDIDFDDYQLRK